MSLKQRQWAAAFVFEEKWLEVHTPLPVLILAQLVAPPLQPGPVRLPSKAPRQRPAQQGEVFDLPPDANVQPQETSEPQPSSEWLPEVQGKTPYSQEELETILSTCGRADSKATLNACAAAITARLIQDGYVNSRVYTLRTPEPGALDVVMGTIAELRITSEDEVLQQQVEDQLTDLIGTVLHIPTLEKALVKVRKRGAGDIKGGMGRLGSDPTKAVVNLKVSPAPPVPLMVDVGFENNGNVGSGEWKSGATLLQQGFIKRGDTALLFLELNLDGQLELGGKTASATYTWPINEKLSVTGSLGYSKSSFVEFRRPAHDFSFRTLQGLLQLETVLLESDAVNWTAAAAFSGNRSDSYESGHFSPDLVPATGFQDSWTRSGFLKLSSNLSGFSGPTVWNINAYFSQGIAGIIPDDHLNALDQQGIRPGEARAIGGIADFAWLLSTTTTINLRAASQFGFDQLPGGMAFNLGSAVGLRGVPGSLISGDSGYLGTGEVVWTAWSRKDQSLQLIPYVGIGGIHTENAGGILEDSIGVKGLIGRYQRGRWTMELGWVNTFNSDDNPGLWTDWVLGHGLHTNVRYSF